MASISAALRLAPGPDPGVLDRISPAPDRWAVQRWQAPPAGLAWAGAGEPGLHFADAGYALAFDGRLDNRDELLDRLGSAPDPDPRAARSSAESPGSGRPPPSSPSRNNAGW